MSPGGCPNPSDPLRGNAPFLSATSLLFPPFPPPRPLSLLPLPSPLAGWFPVLLPEPCTHPPLSSLLALQSSRPSQGPQPPPQVALTRGQRGPSTARLLTRTQELLPGLDERLGQCDDLLIRALLPQGVDGHADPGGLQGKPVGWGSRPAASQTLGGSPRAGLREGDTFRGLPPPPPGLGKLSVRAGGPPCPSPSQNRTRQGRAPREGVGADQGRGQGALRASRRGPGAVLSRGTRAYLKQVQRDRHGLQLPQQVHGSLLERAGCFMRTPRSQCTSPPLTHEGGQGSDDWRSPGQVPGAAGIRAVHSPSITGRVTCHPASATDQTRTTGNALGGHSQVKGWPRGAHCPMQPHVPCPGASF